MQFYNKIYYKMENETVVVKWCELLKKKVFEAHEKMEKNQTLENYKELVEALNALAKEDDCDYMGEIFKEDTVSRIKQYAEWKNRFYEDSMKKGGSRKRRSIKPKKSRKTKSRKTRKTKSRKTKSRRH